MKKVLFAAEISINICITAYGTCAEPFDKLRAGPVEALNQSMSFLYGMEG
jgi:hypothetical protein